ncbi:MAG TPA: hypothetical protein VGG10_22030 [Rhizomicrobium sp.]|jgi:hypothetical protein
MAQEIHYEIFRRSGAKGGWLLHEVVTARDAARSIAEDLMKSERATGVKIVKETYDTETGNYLTLKIFEDGHNRASRLDKTAKDEPESLPCFTADDLYSYHARSTIARLLSDFLTRNRITVTELIHRADMLEKLEATGTLYQHAIQRIAVAQASSSPTPVAQIIKSLNDLATKAIHRVYRDERVQRFADATPDRFGALAVSLGEQPDARYLLNGAIARYLKQADGWDGKLALLLALMTNMPEEEAGRHLLLSCIDAITAEILSGSAALHELLGEQGALGNALLILVQVFLGTNQASGHDGLRALIRHFARDELPEARAAVANRILAELKSQKRLVQGSIGDELKIQRRLANQVVLMEGKYLGHEDILAAFTRRSQRFVTNEVVVQHLADAKEPDEKLDLLLTIEENIVGAENKRRLVHFLTPVLQSSAFDQQFLTAKTPPLLRIQRLAALQARVRRSGFQDKERNEIADTLDRVASEVESRGKLFHSIEHRAAGAVERALLLLKLCSEGSLTEGRLSAKARELIIANLARPGFLSAYSATMPDKPAPDAALSDLLQTLQKAGITRETGLKSIAA